MAQRYKVTCKKCKGNREIVITDVQGSERILWDDTVLDPKEAKILSGRRRLDGEWGWECVCGNYDLLTKQEIEDISNKQNPDPVQIADIIKNLRPQKPRFTMETV